MPWDINLFNRALKYVEKSFGRSLERIGGEYSISPIVRHLDLEKALETLTEFFGEGEYDAVGIDGSIDYNVNMDLVTVYIAIASIRQRFRVVDGQLELSFRDATLDNRLSTFKVIPFWSDQLPDLTMSSSLLDERTVTRSIESIPTSIMTLGEYYMARRLVEEDMHAKIIFMDRPFASTFSPQFRTARELLWGDRGGVLRDPGLYGKPLSIGKLYLTLYHGPYPGFIRYQPIPGYIKHYLIMKILETAWRTNEDRVNIKELEKYAVGFNLEKRVKRLAKFIDERLGGELLHIEFNNTIYIEDYALNKGDGFFPAWNEVSRLYDRFTDDLFLEKDVEEPNHPLFIDDRPVSIRELSHIIIHQIYRIIHGSCNGGKLVIGIGKDTSVTDLPRVLIPMLRDEGADLPPPHQLPRTDRMIYSLLSTRRRDEFPTPWRSIGYDNAFGTLVYRDSLTPARKVISQPKLLIRNYFQLREHMGRHGGEEVVIKSPVFFYDRPYIESYDSQDTRQFKIFFRRGSSGKEAEVELYLERDLNRLDNLILYILSRFDNPELLESAGHNYLLFLADKEVKRMVKIIRGSVSTVVNNRIYTVLRRMGVYILTRRFREYRAEIERLRRRR